MQKGVKGVNNMTKTAIPAQALSVLASAKKVSGSGSYQQYNQYCGRLKSLQLTPAQYQEAVKRLSKVLGV